MRIGCWTLSLFAALVSCSDERLEGTLGVVGGDPAQAIAPQDVAPAFGAGDPAALDAGSSAAVPDGGPTGPGNAGDADDATGPVDATGATEADAPVTAPSCVDLDGDGAGDGCPTPDCDDGNPHFAADCPDCAAATATGCPCATGGATALCFSADAELAGTGVCAIGVRTCTDDHWTACAGEVLPSPEVCDGADNDCDGETDEAACTPACTDADGDGFGAGCPLGDDCDDANPNIATGCLDCSKILVEGCPCPQEAQQVPCTTGDPDLLNVGQCKAGLRTCLAGLWTGCLGETLPAPEACDALDNDCDGATDEGLPGCAASCVDADGDGYGVDCPLGADCDDGNALFALFCPDCSKGPAAGCPCPTAGVSTPCAGAGPDGVGPCKHGVRVCLGGAWSACTGEVLPAPEACNDIDDDCDGETDEGVPGCAVQPPCIDADGDGAGVGCPQPTDCDDQNPNFAATCPDCTTWDHPGCPCLIPGQLKACVSGDPTLVGVGQCAAGLRTCAAGFWSTCTGEVLPGPELCDGADNDCDGSTDEGVLGPCGDCNPLCFTASAGAGATPFDPTPANSSKGVILTPEGWLTLAESSYSLHFIWIANSAEGTVSKLDTLTGKELGRYAFCSDPSRTAVDPSGDGWVACRGDGKVAKIRNLVENCPDKDGDGVVETSTDLNGDGIIQGNEMMPYGQDECVLFTTNPTNDSLARALGVDPAHHAWVGWWYSQTLRRIHPDTGAIVDTIGIPANPYGLVIDSKGIIWVSGRGGNTLVRVDPATHAVNTYAPPGCFEPYGIAADEWDRIWVANCCCANVAYVFNPAGGGWSSVPTQNRPRGIASNKAGYVFVANDESNAVTRINTTTLQAAGVAQLGGGRYPIGVAVDSTGFVWAVNQGAATATKIHPETLAVVLEHPVGSGPYTYSDMTGSSFFQDVVPEGTYRLSFVGPVLDAYLAEWYEVVWETLNVDIATPGGTSIRVRARAAESAAALTATPWSPTAGPFPPSTFPLDLDALLGPAAHGKQHLQIELILNSAGLLKPYVKHVSLQYAAKQKP
ncbi:MAG: hypothetical protein AMXMBFR64_62550 [Myxococcales bacterium]